MSIDDIAAQIPLDEVEGLTVSGGEPFEQPEELQSLLRQAKARHLHCLVYTGFTYEELQGMGPIFKQCLGSIDMLIDGEYRADIPASLPWAGSGNQRVMLLEKGNMQSCITGKAQISGAFPGDGEIFIAEDGTVTATGIFDSRTLMSA